MSLHKLQHPLIQLVQKAGKAILEIYTKNRDYLITTKADHSPLTQADLLANKILINGLQELTPNWPVLSEEGISIPWEQRRQWEQYWLIDPLDGTRQFIRHVDEFTVNVALIKNHQPIIGVLYVPVTQETYYACHDWGGVFKLDAKENVTAIKTRVWRKDETVILTSQTACEEVIKSRFAHLGKCAHIKMSSSWKFAWLAEGKADISPRFGDTCEWDTAAGQCILELAGGALMDLQGNHLCYNARESLINPHFIALGDVTNLYSVVFAATAW